MPRAGMVTAFAIPRCQSPIGKTWPRSGYRGCSEVRKIISMKIRSGGLMKGILAVLTVVLCIPCFSQEQNKDKKEPPTLKSILLEQLRSTHDKAEWFVPANTAVDGLTAEQAAWTDVKGNHAVGQLAYHIWFWDKEELAKFKGEPPVKYSGKNDDTFANYDPKNWQRTVKDLDQVLTDWEKAVEAADEA